MLSFLRRYRNAGRARVQLDELLMQANPEATLTARLEWLEELFHWIRSPGLLSTSSHVLVSGELQVSRIRYFLQRLDMESALRNRVCRTLRGLSLELSSVDFFVRMGIPGESGIFAELMNRLYHRILPRVRLERDLGDFCQRNFSTRADIQWLERLDANTLLKIGALFKDPQDPEHFHLQNFDRDLFEALVLLSTEICSLGLSYELRHRFQFFRVSESPFLRIHSLTRGLGFALANVRIESTNVELQRSYDALAVTIAECRDELRRHKELMDEKGVSVDLVYRLEKIEACLYRAELISSLLAGQGVGSRDFVLFLARVIEDNTRRERLGSLFSDNLTLLAKKIADRSAETGWHYIARNRREFFVMLRAAFGGGLITALTALAKIFIESFQAAYFVRGFLLSLNYSVSFIFIQAFHFTLATKQPAMTAHALAEKMSDLKTKDSLIRLGEEARHLFRSQLGSVTGNLLGVIPAALLLGLLFRDVFKAPLLDSVAAIGIFEKHSFFGLTPFFAFWTGILLWISSLAAGWVDNWLVYREIPLALSQNRRLRIVFGRERLTHLVSKVRGLLGPLTGNISLGILLGMSPKFFEFFGVGLEVRHVTLATGALTYASLSLPASFFTTLIFWKAAVGILSIGAMNVLVSFGMSLLVAVWARRLRASQRSRFYLMFVRKLFKRPWELFKPSRK